MAKPVAITESGSSKVLLLADSSVTTPGANTPSSIIQGTSGESTYPVGWQGVASHRIGDQKLKPGGFTLASAPMMLVGGYDNSAAGTVQALRTDENGLLLTSPRNAMDLPLQQPTAGVSLSAAAEAGFALADTIRYQYLQRLQLICVGTVLGGTGAGSWTLKNGNGGTVLQMLPGKMGTPAILDTYTFEFPTPHKTAGTGGSFTLTPSSTFLGTWQIIANGFRSVL